MLPYEFEPLRTERLTLRMMAPGDVDDVHAYQSRDDVCRYLLFDPRTRDQVEASVARHSTSTTLAKDGDYWQIAVELQTTDASPSAGGEPGVTSSAGVTGSTRVIGDIYFTLKSVENLGGEIGWTFHPDFHGRGYASEAASAVLGVAFDQIGLHRVIAELDPRNDASIALCTRLGMREEAHFVKDLMFRGEWADTGIYAILEEEWRPSRRE